MKFTHCVHNQIQLTGVDINRNITFIQKKIINFEKEKTAYFPFKNKNKGKNPNKKKCKLPESTTGFIKSSDKASKTFVESPAIKNILIKCWVYAHFILHTLTDVWN